MGPNRSQSLIVLSVSRADPEEELMYSRFVGGDVGFTKMKRPGSPLMLLLQDGIYGREKICIGFCVSFLSLLHLLDRYGS